MKTNIMVTVDRIEEGIAVIEVPSASMIDDEELEYIHLWKKDLPDGTKEGSVLNMIFEINKEEEEARRNEIAKLQQELLDRNK